MKYVEWLVRSSYDSENAALLSSKIRVSLRDLVDFYAFSHPKAKKVDHGVSSSSCSIGDKFTKPSGVDNEEVLDFGEIMSQMFRRESGNLESCEEKSELDKYLGDAYESLNDPSFDLLMWWKDQKKRYPILAKMARDVLAIPVSTVASESAFSTGGRVVDSFRTSLTPKMVEALILSLIHI